MEISWWRDMVIVIWGLVGTIVLIIITVVAFLLYKRINKFLDSADTIAARTNDLIDYAEEEVLQPLVKFGTVIQGIIQGAVFIADLFKKKEGKRDE